MSEAVTSLNESRATQFKSTNDGGKSSNDASLELLQVFLREFLGITPKPSSDYTEEIKAMRKRFFGLTKGLSPETSLNNRLDYEQKYPRDRFGEEATGNARVWLTYLDEAESFDREKVEGWKDTADVLLVFAGLFSGVITTFVSQASQSLQRDNNQVSASLLFEMTQLLRAQSSGTPIDNVPHSTITPTSPFRPSTNAFLVNGLWFTSLAITLSTALFAVLAKQWLYYYLSSIPGTANEKARARQLRFKGFKLWKVGAIVDLLPILLHLAVGIFLAGIIIMLFPLDVRVAWTIVIITGTTYALYFISVILPIVYPECPYTTSLTIYAGVLFFSLRGIHRWIGAILKKVLHHSEWENRSQKASLIFKLISPNRISKTIRPLLRYYFYSLVPRVFFHALVDRVCLSFRRLGGLVSAKDFQVPQITNWREENLKKAITNAASLEFEALDWLSTTSFNTSVHRIIARCVSVHSNLGQEFEVDTLENFWRTLDVSRTNVMDLRYGLCLDLLAAEHKHWSLFRSIPDVEGSQLDETEYLSYCRISRNVINSDYDQILKDASGDDTLKLPLAMWRCFFAQASGDAVLAAHILTSEDLHLFYWRFDPQSEPTSYTDVVSFQTVLEDVGEPRQWIFDYLFRYFRRGNPDHSSDSKSFETRYLLLVSVYRNLTSGQPLIADGRLRQEFLISLFRNFHGWLLFTLFTPRHFSPKRYLAFFEEICCVDAFWSESMTDKARVRAALCLDEIWDSMDTETIVDRFPFTECCNLTLIYQWCSRDLYQYLSKFTSPMFALLFMPQNRTRLCTILSNDPDAVSNLSKCFQNSRNCRRLRISEKYIFSSLMDLFGSVELVQVPLYAVLYNSSVLVQVWKFLVFHKLDATKFLLVVKSKLDQEKLNELYGVMTEQAQRRDISDISNAWRLGYGKRKDVLDAIEASAREFGQIIGVSHPQLESTANSSAPEGAADRDHETEERAQVSNVNEREGSRFVAYRIKKIFGLFG